MTTPFREEAELISREWVVRNGFRPFDLSQKKEYEELSLVIEKALTSAHNRAIALARTSIKQPNLAMHPDCTDNARHTINVLKIPQEGGE